MTAVITKPKLSFSQFINQLPDEEGCYELVNGEIMRKQPTRKHDDIADEIADILKMEAKRSNLNYRISGRIVIRTETQTGQEQGRYPDLAVVDKDVWESNLTAQSVLYDAPVLVVEVVSTNWEDDYIDKLTEYQLLGIKEYWLIDYLAVASRSWLGNPKQPTIFVCTLDENNIYQIKSYQGDNRIESSTFPKLKLTPLELFEK
ncbi:Uma2 family endonuclease [Geminocystis herdmanii]|uniref:Uma2 family endonuclease n=1 Tax=Geminocystis herdmanii TaxID=669359 RepID=UPI0003480AD9|nr:Uma2 family endonuclease [Geminocystis herdmanii]